MAKKIPQPLDLNVMQPTDAQRVPARVAELPAAAVQTLPERAQRFGSLVHGFAGPATRLLDPR